MLKQVLIVPVLIFLYGGSTPLLCQSSFPVIDGWEKSDTLIKYDADFLWDYINGAADYYLSYNFLELEVCEYSRSEDEYIKAEVYNHQNPMNAFGIYAYERPPEGNFVELGAEAYRAHSALNFYCDKYYVKIHSHLSDEDALNAIEEIGKALAERHCSKNMKSTILDDLPLKNRLPHSEKYFPANYLGYSFLNNALEASYISGEEKYKLFFIEQENSEKAQEMLDSYLQFAKSNSIVKNKSIYPIDDMFNDKVTILIQDNLLYGIYGTHNDSLAHKILQFILEN